MSRFQCRVCQQSVLHSGPWCELYCREQKTLCLPLRRECAWCHEPATVRIGAQWTLFDWDHVQVCSLHIDNAIRRFRERRVDGDPPSEITSDSMIAPSL